MKRSILTLLAVLVAAPVAQAGSREVAGTWMAYVKEKRPSQFQLSMNLKGDGNNSSGFDRADFTGLSNDQVFSSTRVPVQFELRREAGTILFEGSFRDGKGEGDFTFEPNRDFPRQLEKIGIDFDAGRHGEDRELYQLAMFDVSIEFIRSMHAIGYRVPLDKFVAFRIFDVDPEYVREMEKVGFRKLSADKLVETRIHGATPEYIREMRAAGEDLSLDQYVQSRSFQVTPGFADEMGRLGYTNLDRDRLVQFRIHGVTTEFVQEVRKLGYTNISADQLVQMRIHGVTPEFIKRVAKAGYWKVPIDKLVQMRIFDIEPEMVKALDDDKR